MHAISPPRENNPAEKAAYLLPKKAAYLSCQRRQPTSCQKKAAYLSCQKWQPTPRRRSRKKKQRKKKKEAEEEQQQQQKNRQINK